MIDMSAKKIVGLLGALASVALVGCGRQQNASDAKNTRTNDTSEYVEQHMNTNQFKRFTRDTSYDKITNTVEFHLTPQMSREMKDQRVKGVNRSNRSADRMQLHNLINKQMSQLHKKAHNKTAKARIVLTKSHFR